MESVEEREAKLAHTSDWREKARGSGRVSSPLERRGWPWRRAAARPGEWGGERRRRQVREVRKGAANAVVRSRGAGRQWSGGGNSSPSFELVHGGADGMARERGRQGRERQGRG